MRKNSIEEYRKGLAKALYSLPVAYPESGEREIVIRCPFCGDSDKSHLKGHLYVKMDFGPTEVPCFYCQRCKVRGYITEDFLKDLNLLEGSIMTLQKKFSLTNNSLLRFNKFRLNSSNIKLLPPLNTIDTKMKMQYIANRLGIKLTVADVLKYKIVLNFYDFIKYNSIKKLNRDKRILDSLNSQYVGFISSDNNYIVMRNIGDIDNYKKRYINYNIFDSYDNTKKFYILKNSVDVMNNVDFVLAEGVFDILGVYNHIYNKDDNNKIYAAVCGGGFESVIRYLIRLGFIFCNIHIYSDKDMNINFYKKIKKRLGPKFRGNFIVYYNELGKDYGVTKENIKLCSINI